MRAASIGAAVGAITATDSLSVGKVVGAFRSGFYALFGEALIAVGNAAIPRGPLHLTVAGAVPLPLEGSAVSLSPRQLSTDTCSVFLDSAAHWQPAPLTRRQVDAASATLSGLHAPVPTDLVSVWPSVEESLLSGQIETTVALLEGRGEGLTPTGDDVLAGLILFDAVRGIDHRALVPAIRTNRVSKAFLHWAARGQLIEPVHELLHHATLGTGTNVATTVRKIRAIGATSGDALLAGLILGARPPVRVV